MEMKTQLKIVFYNFLKKLFSLLTDCAFYFQLDFTCAPIARVPGS